MHEEQPGLVVQHMVVDSGDLDAVAAQGADHGVHFLGDEDEVARDGGAGSAQRLEVDRDGRPHGRRRLHAAAVDRLAPRKVVLQDAAVQLALGADRTVDGRNVELGRDGRGRSGRRRSREGCVAQGQARVQGGCELHRIAVRFHVHVHGRRFGAQQVVVQGGDLEAAGLQLRHYRVDLRMGQDQVAHDHGLVPHGLEGDPGAQSEAGLQRHAIEGHRQVRPWQGHLVDPAGLHRARLAQRLAHGVPVGLGLGLGGEEAGSKGPGDQQTAHVHRGVLRDTIRAQSETQLKRRRRPYRSRRKPAASVSGRP